MSADTDNMATTKTFIILLIALLVGVLVGMWLAERRTPPNDPRKTKAAKPPMATKRIDDLHNADFRDEASA